MQNRVIFTAQDYAAQLVEASNYLTANYAGLTIEAGARAAGRGRRLRGEIVALMQAAVQAGSEAAADRPPGRW